MTGGRQPRKPMKELSVYKNYKTRLKKRVYAQNGLACSRCGSMEIMVVDSRGTENHTIIRRRRVCTECELRTTTYEVPQQIYDALPHGRTSRVLQAEKKLFELRKLLRELVFDQDGDDTPDAEA